MFYIFALTTNACSMRYSVNFCVQKKYFFILDFQLFLLYINNMASEKKITLEYDSEKNRRNIEERGLPFDLAEFVIADPNMKWAVDDRRDYGEPRYIAYGLVEGMRLRHCFTPRGDKIRVITLYKVHKKEWEKHYGKDD
jgi:uncharacterized DUF497 family protein